MNNKYTVVIKKANGSKIEMAAVGEGMTEQQASEYVTSKQTWRVREAITEGEYTIEVIGDMNNK